MVGTAIQRPLSSEKIENQTVAGVNERDRGGHAIPATRSFHGFRIVIAADGRKALAVINIHT